MQHDQHGLWQEQHSINIQCPAPAADWRDCKTVCVWLSSLTAGVRFSMCSDARCRRQFCTESANRTDLIYIWWRGARCSIANGSDSQATELCEELALANSIRDFSENHDELEDGSNEAISYSVKYLGNTPVPTPRSENATAEAVKSIITAAKGNKKLQRVSLSISPKGIEMIDTGTGETLLQVSIYQISYCSADANHDHVFAFVGCTLGSEAEVKEMCFRRTAEEINLEGPLVCHAFLCQKRKMAQTVTLTVARSFERAFQIWQSKQFHAERKRKELEERMERELRGSQELVRKAVSSESNSSGGQQRDESECRSLLIDFNSELTEICSDAHHHRELLQNTWVSFEDDQKPQEFLAVPTLSSNSGWSGMAICSN